MAEYISRNTSLHVYKETTEELMICTFRSLHRTRIDFPDKYQHVLSKAIKDATSINSRHSVILQNAQAQTFYGRLMEYGDAYMQSGIWKLVWARSALIEVNGGVSNGNTPRTE